MRVNLRHSRRKRLIQGQRVDVQRADKDGDVFVSVSNDGYSGLYIDKRDIPALVTALKQAIHLPRTLPND